MLQVAATERYRTFDRYLREKFGEKVYKVTIDAGFTCPNLDGSAGWGGCTFCNNEGFSVHSRNKGGVDAAIDEQILQGMKFKRRRYKAEKFLAYFQAFTNTYNRPASELKEMYDRALAHPEVVGLSIGTRPDCVPDDVLDLIESYARECEVWLELGVQTSHDHTLERINRCHDYACFVVDVYLRRNIDWFVPAGLRLKVRFTQ